MYYIEAKIGEKTKLWTGREWVRSADAIQDDIAIKGYKHHATALNVARKLQKNAPHYTLQIQGA